MPYIAGKYQMEELSDSYEKKMLESLRKEAMEDGAEDSEDGAQRDIKRLHYGNDSLSDTSDEDHLTHVRLLPYMSPCLLLIYTQHKTPSSCDWHGVRILC